MALTPEKIAELDKLTGLSGSSVSSSRADEIRKLAGIEQPTKGLEFKPSFTGNNFDIAGGTDKTLKPESPSTFDIVKGLGKSMISGSIESGKDIAGAVGAGELQKKFDTLDESDKNYLETIISLRNKAANEKNTEKVEHFQNLIKNYKTTRNESIADVFPALNKSTEQIIGDFTSLGLEAIGGGALTTNVAKKVAGEKIGLPLVQRMIQGGLTGGKYGTLFGVSGALQENESLPGILKSAGVGGLFGVGTGALTTGLFGKRPVNVQKEIKGLENTIGKVIQGSEKDIPKAKQALSNIDISDVKTYKDLGTKLNDRVVLLSEQLDDKVLTDKTPISFERMNLTKKVNNQTISHNYVEDALNQLKDFYQKTNDQVGVEEVNQLINKAKSKGLAPVEINNIAKLHGSELSGFNASGELASGLSRQAAENTRAGVKATARELAGEGKKAFETIDDEISGLIRTRDLVGEVAEKVNQLKQRIDERGFGEKVGRLIFQVADRITGGGLKGFVQSFIPRGQGLKILNALDLEKSLQKNLKFIESILQSDFSEKTIIQKLEELIQKTSKGLLKEVNVDDKIKSFFKNPKMGLSIQDITKNIPKDDLRVMSDFTDYVAGSYKPNSKMAQQLELDASRIAERYGIGEFKTTKGLANQFGRVLEGLNFKI